MDPATGSGIMTIYDLKPAFQNLLRPFCEWLARAGMTPNGLTLIALFLSLIPGLLIWILDAPRWTLLSIPLVLLVRMGLNALDGMLAREHGLATPAGAILNELADVVSDMALYLPFALIPGVPDRLVILVVLLAALTEMAGVVALQIGASRRYDGPLGQSARAFVFGVLALLLYGGVRAGPWLDVLLGWLALLLGLTIYNRARSALRESGAASRP